MSKETFGSSAPMPLPCSSLKIRISLFMAFYIRLYLFWIMALLFLYPKKHIIQVLLPHVFGEIAQYPGLSQGLEGS